VKINKKAYFFIFLINFIIKFLMKIKKFIIEYQIKTTAAIKLISLKTTDPLIANKSYLSKEDIILILLTVERYFLQEEIFYFDYDLS